MEQKDIQKKFNFSNVNFLEYHRIKILVNNFVKKYKNEDMFIYPQPCVLKTLSDLHFNTTRTKGIYNKLNKVNIEKNFQRKWHQDIGIILDTTAWQQKFRICFKTIHDPYYKWFQYRILHRILGTQKIII